MKPSREAVALALALTAFVPGFVQREASAVVVAGKIAPVGVGAQAGLGASGLASSSRHETAALTANLFLAPALTSLALPLTPRPPAPTGARGGGARALAAPRGPGRPSAASAPEGRASGIRAATPAEALHALTEAFKEPSAQRDSSRSEKLGAFYDGSAASMVKPAVDWWEVGGRRYESTAQLVRALPRLGKSREATYYYRHKNAVDASEHRFNTVAVGVSAGLFGVAGGALLWALGAAVGPIMGAVGGLTFSTAPGLLLFSGFFGAVLGFVGLVAGAMEGGKPSSDAVTGRLHVSGKGLRFIFKGNEVGAKPRVVNLNAYARARTPSSAPAPAPQTFLKGALKGLGMGLAVAVSLMIPLVQVVTIPLMGPGIGMDIGRRLSLRGHAVGGLLGGALGLLVPLSFFAALALGGAQNIALMAVWAGGLGLVGAVLGALLNNPLNRADAWAKVYAPKGQWWNTAP